MNDAVDLARDACRPPENCDQDLTQMLKDLIAKGVPVKVCGTCLARGGVDRNHPYREGAEKSPRPERATPDRENHTVMTFKRPEAHGTGTGTGTGPTMEASE